MESSTSPSSAAAMTAAPTSDPPALTTTRVCTTSGGGGDDGLCEPGKLFVGGIRWGATEEALRDYFGKYGEVAEAIVMKEKATGNARGFGFVSFVDPSVADRVVEDASTKHSILGRLVEVRRAIPRGGQQPSQLCLNDCKHQNGGSTNSNSRSIDGIQNRTKKIFVGGLPANTTKEEFKSHFEKFGRTADVVVMYDRITNRPRGFGFVTFDSEDSVDNAVQNSFQTLNGKTVEVKRAVPSEANTIGNHHKNRGNRNGYRPRTNNGTGYGFGNYPGGVCSLYTAEFGHLQVYGSPSYSPHFYWCGEDYSYGRCGFVYGSPYAIPSTWNGHGFMGARQSPLPYGTAGFYPVYFNANGEINPSVDIGAGGSFEAKARTEGEWNQSYNNSQLEAVSTSPLQAEDKKLNDQ